MIDIIVYIIVGILSSLIVFNISEISNTKNKTSIFFNNIILALITFFTWPITVPLFGIYMSKGLEKGR